jgi:hypothetical protein
MSNLPPPGPPGPPDPEPPYGSVPDPNAEATRAGWSGYEPGAPLGEPSVGQYGVQPYAPYGASPYAAPGYVAFQNHKGASEAQAWGIAAIVTLAVGGFCCMLLVVGAIVPGAVAIAKGRKAMTEIDANPTVWANRSQAMTGFVCGIIATALAAVMLVVGIAFLGLMFLV